MPALFLLFVVVPLIEIFVLIEVGQVIGTVPTVALLVGMSLLGAWMVRREGVRAWSRFRRTLSSGRLPTAEVVDGALVLLGGALMLTPGFVTDVLGLLLVLPPSRALVNRAVRRRTRSSFGLGWAGPGARRPPRREPEVERTVDVEVVDVQRTPRTAGGSSADPGGPSGVG